MAIAAYTVRIYNADGFKIREYRHLTRWQRERMILAWLGSTFSCEWETE